MKKSQFSGIDFFVVEKFKAPIEQFDTIDDFQDWANGEYSGLFKNDYGGQSAVIANQRYRMGQEWKYMLSEGYTPAERLLIFNGVSKDLKINDCTYMPSYNKVVLAKTMEQVNNKLSADKKSLFSFGDMYKSNLKEYYVKDINKDYTGWVIIPSRSHDGEHFDNNVRKLQSVSTSHWCTKSTHAKPYLVLGDFHVYFEKGDPKIAMRFDDDVAVEFQGESNNNRLLPKYFNILEKYVSDNDIVLKDKASQEFGISKIHRDFMKDIYEKIGDAIEKKDYEKVLNYINISTKKDKSGKLILSHYKIPQGFDYKALGLKEEELFENVSGIEGDADFTRCGTKSFGNIEYIGGNANLSGLTLENFGKIREIGGNVDLKYAKVKSFDCLRKIGGDLYLEYAEVGDLYSLRTVVGDIRICESNVSSSQIKHISKN